MTTLPKRKKRNEPGLSPDERKRLDAIALRLAAAKVSQFTHPEPYWQFFASCETDVEWLIGIAKRLAADLDVASWRLRQTDAL